MNIENGKWKIDLTKEIRTFSEFDDVDRVPLEKIKYRGESGEFSLCNRNALIEQFLSIRDSCKSILEIGVCRNGVDSSTFCFLNNKNPETVYVGIDLEDKSFLKSFGKNVFTIKNSSWDLINNINTIKGFGITEFDFIFIDGDHSINSVLKDWEYTSMLSDRGIVGFHDTSGHYGPYEFIKALDTEKWDVIQNVCPDDYGIGFCRKAIK